MYSSESSRPGVMPGCLRKSSTFSQIALRCSPECISPSSTDDASAAPSSRASTSLAPTASGTRPCAHVTAEHCSTSISGLSSRGPRNRRITSSMSSRPLRYSNHRVMALRKMGAFTS
eukprot:Amastigsp_a508957_22.p3 type:complete len:117 gc:universal Amastigsp_a508957_22:763-413(-)